MEVERVEFQPFSWRLRKDWERTVEHVLATTLSWGEVLVVLQEARQLVLQPREECVSYVLPLPTPLTNQAQFWFDTQGCTYLRMPDGTFALRFK